MKSDDRFRFYADDGFSGTNFNRPDFQRMMADAEEGKIPTVIVKDMSRFGRDYLKVGYYTEVYFVENNVHFIAINDGVDNHSEADSDFTPFRNIINEWYAKDTSKKVRAVPKAKGNSGKHLTNCPPYGYYKEGDDKQKWYVDEQAAKVVKEIYSLCIKGFGPTQIARMLTERGTDSPIVGSRHSTVYIFVNDVQIVACSKFIACAQLPFDGLFGLSFARITSINYTFFRKMRLLFVFDTLRIRVSEFRAQGPLRNVFVPDL